MLEILPVTSDIEIENVVFLAKEIWSDHYVPIIGHKQVDYMLGKFQSCEAVSTDIRAGYEYFGIYSEGNLVGYLSLQRDLSNQSVFLSKIYIHSSARGEGIGAKTMKFILKQCEKSSADKLWLTVNKNNVGSIDWYKKQDFEIVEELVSDIGEGFVMDDYKMEKIL